MIKSIPSVWDETIVLPPSEIGEVAAFARRGGDRWFLAVLNGPEARTLRLPLSFLGAGNYRALMVRDREDDPAAVKIGGGDRHQGRRDRRATSGPAAASSRASDRSR